MSVSTEIPKDVFISYSRLDANLKVKIAEFLDKKGIHYWDFKKDEDIGDIYPDEISGAIDACLVFLILLSTNSATSNEVLSEFTQAFKDQKTILCVRLDETPETETYINRISASNIENAFRGINDEVLARIHSAISKHIRETPKPPYFETDSNEHMLAVSDELIYAPTMPFSLVTGWGLDRSKFIVLLEGAQGRQLLTLLANTEFKLFDALKVKEKMTRLATRWWVHVNWQTLPNGPANKPELWDSLYSHWGGHSHFIRTRGLPPNCIPGIIIDFNSAPGSNQSIQSILAWCEAIFKQIFLDLFPAIFVTFSDRDTVFYREKIAGLLKRQLPEVRLETLNFERMYEPVHESTSSQQFPKPLHLGTGAHLVHWLDTAKGDIPKSSSWAELTSTMRDLLDLYNQCLRNANPIRNSTIQYLAEDLLQFSHPLSVRVYTQLLQLVRLCIPELLPNLIFALARSSDPTGRRASLVFSKENDVLMDAWVAGLRINVDSLAPDWILDADPDKGPLVDDISTALLRDGYRHDRLEGNLKLIRDFLWSNLTASQKSVVDLVAGKIQQNLFLRTKRATEYAIAVRAGYNFDVETVLAANQEIDHNSPDCWWLLTAMSPTSLQIGKLLSMSPTSRAILGLCSVEEWNEFKLDPITSEYIKARRRGRKITY